MHLLAFDHREAFMELFDGSVERVAAGKQLAYEAVRATDCPDRGLLVDERLGAATARRARAEGGLTLAMPVERSGQALFTFDYDDWRRRIEDFDPDICKVLVRYRADGDRDGNALQRARLRELSDHLLRTRQRFLFELLVPGASIDERPELARRAMEECQADGIEVDVWKLEGTASAEAAAMLAAQARATGREDVVCTVLGAGADAETVRTWLTTAARTDGWSGFAIGRSIWGDPLRAWRDGAVDEAGAVQQMSDRYAAFVTVFDSARAAA